MAPKEHWERLFAHFERRLLISAPRRDSC